EAEEDGAAFYRETVHPLLEGRCFKCHGAEEKLKGNFRLTSREGLLAGGDLGSAYNPDDTAASLVLTMLSYVDDEHQMPPKGKLPDAEIDILKRWVERGAPYDAALEIKGETPPASKAFTITEKDRQYWAYRPFDPAAKPPVAKDAAWNANGIDAHIRHGLEAAGLEPNPPAPPGALCRRVFYDLIGLPPTPAEVRDFETRFAADPDRAWNDLVEDLLDRPQYGEKWARHWLDLVRYAETNGFERDNPKPQMWRYRDYVIDAFNGDTPYDRFVIEQLAGDEIAEPTRASLTATGYYRLMQWDDEPADRKQHVYDVLADNVQVTAETFLGTSMNCCRCHDHKADPISMRDYYSFMAFFHGLTPYATEGTIRPWADPAELASFEKNRAARLAAEREKLDALETEMTAHLKAEGQYAAASETRARVLTFIDDARGRPVTWDYVTDQPAPGWNAVASKEVKSWTKGVGGFGKKGTPNARVGTEWAGPDIWMRTDFGLQELPESLVLEIHHDEDVEVFLNGAEIFRAAGFSTDYETVELGPEAIAALQTGRNVVAVHCHQTGGGQYIDLALRSAAQKPQTLPEALKRGGPGLAKAMAGHFGRDVVKEWNDRRGAIDALRRELPGTPLNVVKETGQHPDPLQIHLRGSAHAPGDPVEPGFPAILASATSDPRPAEIAPVESGGAKSSGRRLALANWIVDPANPMTARVIVNRLWQHHFGRGIVPSTNDFGKLGEPPTHPELLDWLAAELIRRGWSLKAMHRLILDSRTYRLSSAPSEASLAKDPQNSRLWRHDMRRLTAEELRDSILAVSGNLNLKAGGDWVFPPLPDEVLATASRPDKAWPVSRDPAEHTRRSIYIHVKRSLRHPMMADFDQADTDGPCAVRFATTVPTQALAMLNSEFVNRQARVFAEHLRQGAGAPEARVREALERTLQRPATDPEIAECLALMKRLQTENGLDEDAAFDRVALLALNLNEFLFLD
ncbi:MAG: PSD1 domain-containing protein, partial [Verrucomicrobiae bacterium]|nr:PSD1 domain-containing protein [Verrucomicrobiae bacterium]